MRLLLPGCLRRAWCWRVRLSGLPSYSEASSAAAWSLSRGHRHVSLRKLSEEFRLCWSCRLRVRTWKSGTLFPFALCIWQSRSLCLGVACGEQFGFFGRVCLLLVRKCLVRQWIHVCISCGAFGLLHQFSTAKRARILKSFFLCSHAERRSVLSRCFSFQSRCTARTWKTPHCFYELHVTETRDDGQHF